MVNKFGYVLLQPVHQDYLASEISGSGGWGLAWCSHPAKAVRFAEFDQARLKAQKICNEKGYGLQVCRLNETETQYMVELIAEVTFFGGETMSRYIRDDIFFCTSCRQFHEANGSHRAVEVPGVDTFTHPETGRVYKVRKPKPKAKKSGKGFA